MQGTRIDAITEECPPRRVWADIGCDHGLVSAGLLRTGRAEKVLAADISAPSLAKAEALCKELELGERLECRLGDGLSVLVPDEAQGILIAGMGAPLIIKLLESNMETAKAADVLVLSAHNYQDRLRGFLAANGWVICRERFVQEGGRHYVIMRAEKGICDYSPRELLFGRRGAAGGRRAWLAHELETARRNVTEIERGGADAAAMRERVRMLEEELEFETETAL